MEITTAPIPIPPAFAPFPKIVIAPHGPLMANGDVALAFGVDASTLRKWRQNGAFPTPVHKQGNATYYKVSDLVAPYYKRFPGALPDPEFDDEMARAKPFSQRQAEREEAGAGGDLAGASRSEGVTELLAAAEQSMLARIGETVTAAVEKLVEREPEPPRVIEAQADELKAQRQEIQRLTAEVAALKNALETERRWRELPFMERVMGKG